MIHTLLSLLISAAVTVIVGYAFGYPQVKVIFGLVPGLVAGVAFFIWRSRVVMAELQTIMMEVQKLLTPANTRRQPKPAEISAKIDKAIEIIRRADRWRNWQVLVGSQLDGQIGTLYYMDGRYKDARPYLDTALGQNWVAKAMLGCIAYRRKELPEMKLAFEAAVRGGKKESLAWNVYAWCLWKSGEVDDAIAVLNRAKGAVPSDERTARNLKALSNGKGMKMQGWAESWYQFRLERPTQQMMQGGRQRMGKPR